MVRLVSEFSETTVCNCYSSLDKKLNRTLYISFFFHYVVRLYEQVGELVSVISFFCTLKILIIPHHLTISPKKTLVVLLTFPSGTIHKGSLKIKVVISSATIYSWLYIQANGNTIANKAYISKV